MEYESRDKLKNSNKIKTFLKKIFSVINQKNHNCITIFGIKFKFKFNKKRIIYNKYIATFEALNCFTDNYYLALVNDLKTKSKRTRIKNSVFKEDIENLNNIIKNINPSKIPQATGILRELQMRILEFSKNILSDIEENTGLRPFMSGGTLLGAVRHKGFIPWDDDIDFLLVRPDYEKLCEYLKKKYIYIDTSDWSMLTYPENLKKTLLKYPNQIITLSSGFSFQCIYGIPDNFVTCDFFALDYYDDYVTAPMIKEFAEKIKAYVLKNSNLAYGKLEQFRLEQKSKSELFTQESNTLCFGIDNFAFYFYSIKGLLRKTDIFPLIKMKFEDTEFWAPNNPHENLKALYNYYNRIPLDIKISPHFTE